MVLKHSGLASEARLWYNMLINIVVSLRCANIQGRDARKVVSRMSIIVSSTLPQSNYYVYTLAYPESMGGAVFYVGKGTSYPGGKDRIDMHESEGTLRKPCNKQKLAVISAIKESGNEIVKTKVAHFESEQDALMYEWALINMASYSEYLTNTSRAIIWLPAIHCRKMLSDLDSPICLRRDRRRRNDGLSGKTHHQVTNIQQFCAKHGINKSKMQQILEGSIPTYNGWMIVPNCDCSV